MGVDLNATLAQRLRGCLEGLAVAVEEGHLDALSGKPGRDAQANTPGSSRDYGHVIRIEA